MPIGYTDGISYIDCRDGRNDHKISAALAAGFISVFNRPKPEEDDHIS